MGTARQRQPEKPRKLVHDSMTALQTKWVCPPQCGFLQECRDELIKGVWICLCQRSSCYVAFKNT